MNLGIRDLELLQALAGGGTLNEAANELFVSQPALSQRLSKMEQRIGVQLFERRGRRLVPTEAGRRLAPSAVRILQDLAAVENDVRELGRHGDNRVRIATQCSTTFSWLTPVIRGFRQTHADAHIQVETIQGDDVAAALLDQRLDVAVLTKLDRRNDGLSLTRLFEDEMVAVVTPEHPWAVRTHVTAKDFASAHVILYDTYDPARIPATPLPLPAGARPLRVTTVPLVTDLVIELVAGGEGVSVLPAWAVQRYVDRGEVVAVHIGARPATRTWYAGVRGDEARPTVLGFVSALTQHFAGARSDTAGGTRTS